MNRKQIKDHIQKHKVIYFCVLTGVGSAGITWLIIREIQTQSIGVGNVADATGVGNVAVAGKKVVIENVSYISANRQGSPSWVVRCKETGEIFTSQRSAAIEMNIPQSEISQQLNGLRDTARGHTFERICLAA